MARQAPVKNVKQLNRDEEEQKLMQKYPTQKIVKGSLRAAGEIPEFGKKRTVEIVCQGDHRTKRRIATSDLHQVKYSQKYLNGLKNKKKTSDKPEKVTSK